MQPRMILCDSVMAAHKVIDVEIKEKDYKTLTDQDDKIGQQAIA